MRMGSAAALVAAVAMVLAGCSGGSADPTSSTSGSAVGTGSGSASGSPSAAPTGSISGTPSGPAASPSGPAASSAAGTPGAASPIPAAPATYTVTGTVLVDGQPVIGGIAGLRAAGVDGSAPRDIVGDRVGDGGTFRLTAQVPASEILYVTINGGITHWGTPVNNAVLLATLLGTQRPASIVVNELTTVASAFAASEYFVGDDLVGSPGDLADSAATAATMADPTTGNVGREFDGDGYRLAMFNSLGNALGACIADAARCGAITRPAGREPGNSTWSGFAATARDPENPSAGMFAIQQGWDTFQPSLQTPPTNGWYLLPS